MEIKNIIKEENIVLNFDVDSKDEFFDKISEVVFSLGIIEDRFEFKKSLIERESISNTGFGDGFAVPHGKSNTVKKTSIFYIRINKGIEWAAFDNKLVNNIFLFAINPMDSNSNYIDVLASLSRKLMDDDFVFNIKNSNSKNKILNYIGG